MSSNFYSRSLPPEVLGIIFDETDTESLPSVLCASSTFYSIAYRSLYREIPNRPTGRKRAQLLQTLANVSDPARHPARLPSPTQVVHLLSLDFHSNNVTANLLRLVNCALKATENLRELMLEFSSTDNFQHMAWCLMGTTFRLRRLYTSVGLDAALFSWLAHPNQRSITELNMRGHQMVPFSLSTYLPSDALPSLTNFRSVHLESSFNTLFLAGRPVQSVGLTLFPYSRLRSLDAACRTSTPVRRLTVLCLEESCSEGLVAEIAVRLPALESLHVVILATPFSDVRLIHYFCALQPPTDACFPHLQTKLRSLVPSLSLFAALRYITFMAPDLPGADAFTVDKERGVVEEWARACPSLRTVILPMGQVWYSEDGKWRCYADEPDFPEPTQIRAQLSQTSVVLA